MEFNKVILGENELRDFENLLLREKMIDSVQSDFSNLSDINEDFRRAKIERINNKKRLLISIMLFEKFDATSMSVYNYSRLVDTGIIDQNACIINGTEILHPTSIIIDNAWKYKKAIIFKIFKITDLILRKFGWNIYTKNTISDELLLDLCDCYLYKTKSDFILEYCKVISITLEKHYKSSYLDTIYGHELDFSYDANEMELYLYTVIDKIYNLIDSVGHDMSSLEKYNEFNNKLDAHLQQYHIPFICLSCDKSWNNCCTNSEFYANVRFDCFQREDIGSQKFAKLNGLVLSHTEGATLFDNSLKFRHEKPNERKIIEDVYHIVNVDLSKVVRSLPEPQSVDEALRLRDRPEIASFRNVFLRWCQNLYRGDISEAEYIKKDFGAALNFYEQKYRAENKKKSMFHCFFEALGNQIPYISNIVGVVSPFANRRKLLEEEKHKWFLLTR